MILLSHQAWWSRLSASHERQREQRQVTLQDWSDALDHTIERKAAEQERKWAEGMARINEAINHEHS